MKVIIAEKPSLARNIVNAIDPRMKKSEGLYHNDEYIVTYAFGHLFKLYDLEMYREDYDATKKYEWKESDLPFFPSCFKFGLMHDDGVIKQFKIIRELINRDDVDTIINAGDSDREGEIIVRLIIKYALKTDKQIKRLWMPDQTPITIKQELSLMRDDSEFDNLANEGFARTYVDWIYGINLTRLATLRCHTLLRVGRVIAPIVETIYNREMEIINFIPRKYYTLSSKTSFNGEIIELNSKKEFSNLDEAMKAADIYNQYKGKVTAINQEKKIIPPGKLYSLSKLQGELGKKYKMSLDKSLEIVQSLYEKGYVTYPRTPSQHLAENEKDKFKEIINNFQKVGVNIIFKNSKYIFDDSKIESHSALTPTYKIPHKSDLTEDENKVYKVIAHRFFAVFSKENFEVNRTSIEISLSDLETFKLTGDVIINKGWTIFEEREKKDKVLPPLKLNDEIEVNFVPLEKETTPPKRYSVETLNNFLKNPFRDKLKAIAQSDDEIDEQELKAMFEGVELGTEATRSGIINNAIKSRYIALKDNTYSLLPLGKYYIDNTKKMNILISKEKTAELGKSLKRVYRQEITIEDSLEVAKKEIENIFSNCQQIEGITLPPRVFEVDKSKILCKCPRCGKPIAVSDKAYRCCFSECGLSLYKDNKLFTAINKKLTKTIAKEIFTKGKVTFDDLVSKNGKKYSATLVADFSNKFVAFKFEFPQN